jgi:hypothetical protein
MGCFRYSFPNIDMTILSGKSLYRLWARNQVPTKHLTPLVSGSHVPWPALSKSQEEKFMSSTKHGREASDARARRATVGFILTHQRDQFQSEFQVYNHTDLIAATSNIHPLNLSDGTG